MLVGLDERLHVVGVRGDQLRVALESAADDMGVGDVGFVAAAEALADLLGPDLVKGVDSCQRISSALAARTARLRAKPGRARSRASRISLPGLDRHHREPSDPAITSLEGDQCSRVEDEGSSRRFRRSARTLAISFLAHSIASSPIGPCSASRKLERFPQRSRCACGDTTASSIAAETFGARPASTSSLAISTTSGSTEIVILSSSYGASYAPFVDRRSDRREPRRTRGAPNVPTFDYRMCS